MVDRRDVLRGIGAATAAAIAGCGSGQSDEDISPSDTETPSRTETPSGTEAPTETVTGDGFEGARIRAPLVGFHVTGIDAAGVDPAALSADLGVPRADVRVRADAGTVEVLDGEGDPDAFVEALRAAGVDADESDVRDGVTAVTRESVVAALRDRLDSRGVSGGSVSATEDGLVVVELPGIDLERAREIVSERWRVQIVAEVRRGDAESATNTTVLSGSDIAEVGSAFRRSNGSPAVQVTLTPDGAQRFENRLIELGFTREAAFGNCDRTDSADSEGSSYCLLTMSDSEMIQANSFAPDFAHMIGEGHWREDPAFTIAAQSMSQARQVRDSISAGSLPTTLDLDAPNAEVTESR